MDQHILASLLEIMEINENMSELDKFSQLFENVGDMFEKGEPFDFAKEFNALKSNCEKVEYMANQPFMKNIVIKTNFEGKCDELAVENRQLGNKYFSAKKDGAALSQYNLSILYSEDPMFSQVISDSLSLGYSNRSAVLFRQNRFADALLDIDRAFKYGVPSHLHMKLLKRKGQCYDAVRSYEQAIKCFEEAKILANSTAIEKEVTELIAVAKRSLHEECLLTMMMSAKTDLSKITNISKKEVPSVYQGVNQKIPAASNCLTIVNDDQGGGHVVATEDIPPGVPVIVEDAFASCLGSEQFYENCYYCFVRTDIPVPCRQCRTIFYCGEECRDLSWKLNHELDCRIVHLFQTSRKSNFFLQHHLMSSFKVIINTGVTRLNNIFKQRSDEQAAEDRNGGSVDGGFYDSHDFANILEMGTADGECWPREEFKSAYYAIILVKILELIDFFKDDLFSSSVECSSRSVARMSDLSSFRVFVGTLILRLLTNLQFRGRYITEPHFMEMKSRKAFMLQTHAYGSYAMVGLLRHSCDPNTFIVFHGATAVVYSFSSISKGTELTDNNMHCNSRQLSLNARTKIHQKYNQFVCACAVCTDNWPLESNMPSIFEDDNFPKLKFQNNMTKEMFTSLFFGDPLGVLFLEVFGLPSKIVKYKISERELGNVLTCLRFLEDHLVKPYKEIVGVEEVLKQCLVSNSTFYIDIIPELNEISDDSEDEQHDDVPKQVCGTIDGLSF